MIGQTPAMPISLLLATLACGCAGSRATDRASSTYPSSCEDELSPRVVDNIELDELVAVDRGVRWFQAGLYGLLDGLAWLRADGELGFVQIGTVEQLKSGDYGFWECTAEGEGAVRCFNPPIQRNTGTWSPFWSVRVELSDTPRIGEIERWDGGPHVFFVEGVASDGEHALVAHNEYRYEEPEYARRWEDEPLSADAVLTMWDVAKRRAIAEVRIDGVIHEVVTAWCADTCTAVVLHQEQASHRGFPPMRSLLAITVPSGRARTLSDGVDDPTLRDPVAVVRSGDSVILAWRDHRLRQVQLVALDPSGRVRARSKLHTSRYTRLVTFDDGLLALKTHDEWRLLTISPRARVVRRVGTQTDAVGLLGTRFDGGLLLAALSDETSYVEAGNFGFHNWRAEAELRFLHKNAPTDWRPLLGDDIPEWGEGSGGYDVAWLTRPERAAIFLWATGDARAQPRLIPVRAPCP